MEITSEHTLDLDFLFGLCVWVRGYSLTRDAELKRQGREQTPRGMEWSAHQHYHQSSSSKRIRTAECSLIQSRSTPTLGRPEPIDCYVAQGAVGSGLGTFAQRSPGRRGAEGESPVLLLGSDTEHIDTRGNRAIRQSFRQQKVVEHRGRKAI